MWRSTTLQSSCLNQSYQCKPPHSACWWCSFVWPNGLNVSLNRPVKPVTTCQHSWHSWLLTITTSQLDFYLCPCWSTLNSLLTFDCQSVFLFVCVVLFAGYTHPKYEDLFMGASLSECVRWLNCLFLWFNNGNSHFVRKRIDCLSVSG